MPDELDDLTRRTWEEYWAIGLRRRWWFLLPLFLCWTAIWGASWLLPTAYQSEALILVEQQKVPDQYVVPNVTLNLQDRLQSITQQILSRTRLQATIDHFHLYWRGHGLRALLKHGDPIDQMRKDITIELVESPGRPGSFSAFKMSYSARSPKLAQQVNSELTSLFVQENVETQRQLSENTTAFLENQLADARAKMEKQEAKVASFQAKHVGDLPSQLQSNVQILGGLQAQLQNTQHTVDEARQQKIYLESLLQQYQSAQTTLGGEDSTLTPTYALDKELLDLRLRLADLRTRYSDYYPDVIAVKNKIAEVEQVKQKSEEEAAASHQKAGKATSAVDAAAAEELQHGSPTPMMQVQSQLKANQLEIQNGERREKDLESQIALYQSRLNMAPETEQELAEISRGYEESKSNYNSLLQKQMQSQLATSLEQRQQGEQFLVIDPPSLPEKPSAPNRFAISLGGLALGIALGLGLVALLERTDVRVRQEKDLEGIVPARVLVGIPHLSTPEEDHLESLMWWAEVGAAVVIALLVLVGNLYTLYKG
jgi:polysaccharide biosynthesis transport protein